MFNSRTWRQDLWQQIPNSTWDLIIVGGGITGAGILREAARLGARALLVEMVDFGWGTSSRSSKLVHGGLRYLKEGKIGLTWASVHEREMLLHSAPGLVEPLGFLIATYKGDKPGKFLYRAGLTVYDLMGTTRNYLGYNAEEFRLIAPHVLTDGLEGGFSYWDAQTDDARLTFRVIQEALAENGPSYCAALNYARAEDLLRDEAGQVVGVRLQDRLSGATCEARAAVIINATGAWADHLREQLGAQPRIRPLRGSHLIFPAWRFPLAQAISFLHPLDRRPVFAFPWEGVTLVGTTDLDHDQPLLNEPRIMPDEVAYLLAALAHQFPALDLKLEDVIATFAGVRPVIGTGKEDPSKESRDHAIWQENGLLTVTGGKLTTFRMIALDALNAARHLLPELPRPDAALPALDLMEVTLPPAAEALTQEQQRRLVGRYGGLTPALIAAAGPDELAAIPGTHTLWAELRWAARQEGVVHLDDLLLRRTRLGLLKRDGGKALLERIRTICQPELGWDDATWAAETARYLTLWQEHYSLPPAEQIPDWQAMLAAARQQLAEKRAEKRARARGKAFKRAVVVGGVGLAAAFLLRRRKRATPTSED